MFWHLILGLLRDGRSRHGYELMTEYAVRSGNKASPGNFYRELARLASKGLVETGINPPEADARRIPYRIKESGRRVFDRWLTSPTIDDGDFPTWILFVDQIDAESRIRILDRHEESLWLRSKALARLRDDVVARRETTTDRRFDPLPVLLSRQMKLLTSEIESLQELRLEIDACFEPRERSSPPGAETIDVPARRRRSAKK
jgi:DNA-binding PadR family transcriptional regulator